MTLFLFRRSRRTRKFRRRSLKMIFATKKTKSVSNVTRKDCDIWTCSVGAVVDMATAYQTQQHFNVTVVCHLKLHRNPLTSTLYKVHMAANSLMLTVTKQAHISRMKGSKTILEPLQTWQTNRHVKNILIQRCAHSSSTKWTIIVVLRPHTSAPPLFR